MRLFLNTVGRPFSRSPEQAANDIVALLTGEYPAGFYEISLEQKEPPTAAEPDAILSEELWDYSVKLVANLAAVA
jgi:hypothetical protein